jgi:endonuclease-3
MSTTKRTFDIDLAFERLREAVRPYPRAALFELRDEGHDSAFEQLAACIISIRTRDETMLPVARRLFARARTPAEVAALSVEELTELLAGSAFREAKAPQIHAIATQVVAEYGGELPIREEVLLGFRGVGPKCANLVLGIAGGQARIGVDIHVHRVTNRWGYVQGCTPEETLAALEAKLPQQYHLEINELLVPFGKHICTGTLPRCSTCPLLEMCQQVGVTKHR